MRQGEFMVGSGEGMMDSIQSVNPDDISRNRNRNIIPRFFAQQIKRADGEGYIEQEYLELLIPGDAKSSPVHLVDDRLRQMYSSSYKAFKEGRELPAEGTPVEVWLGANDSRVHVLRSLHLRTVEAIAGMSDGSLTAIGMGARELRERAKQFLEVQDTSNTAKKLAGKDAEIDELRRRLTALENNSDQGPEDEDEEEADTVIPAGARRVEAVKADKPKSRGKRG